LTNGIIANRLFADSAWPLLVVSASPATSSSSADEGVITTGGGAVEALTGSDALPVAAGVGAAGAEQDEGACGCGCTGGRACTCLDVCDCP
jgi:hypothetical protein